MIQLALFVVCILLTLVAIIAKGVYARVGLDGLYPSYVSPNQQRAMQFISRHKDFVGQLMNVLSVIFASGAIYLSVVLFGLFSLLFAFIFIEGAFFLLPAVNLPAPIERLAYLLAPPLRKLAEKLDWAEKKMRKINDKIKSDQSDTGVYTLADLKNFLKNQSRARDNQVKAHELNNLIARIEFDEKKASDIMVKLSKVRTVGASEALGPILINELHQSGFKYFPVEEEFNKEIIGILELDSLTSLQKQGDAKDAMEKRLFYIGKDSSLRHVLDESFSSGSQVFLCKNESQKPVGMISVQQVIEELAGEKEIEEEVPAGDEEE